VLCGDGNTLFESASPGWNAPLLSKRGFDFVQEAPIRQR